MDVPTGFHIDTTKPRHSASTRTDMSNWTTTHLLRHPPDSTAIYGFMPGGLSDSGTVKRRTAETLGQISKRAKRSSSTWAASSDEEAGGGGGGGRIVRGCYLHVAGAGSFPIWEGAGLALLIIYSLRCCLRATAITWPVVLFDFECYIYIFTRT